MCVCVCVGNFRSNCDKVKRCTPGYADELMKYLQNQKYFTRHNGADHVVMWSLGHYHPWPKNGCNVFMSEFCKECAVTCYWMDPVKKDNHFISMPFPSSYHSSDAMIDVPWKYQNSKYVRNITALYLGSTKTLNPDHTKIRRSMTAQCKAHPKCEWLQIAHSSTDGTISQFVQFYRKSIFCLCPPGDDPGRKALFDIITSGWYVCHRRMMSSIQFSLLYNCLFLQHSSHFQSQYHLQPVSFSYWRS